MRSSRRVLLVEGGGPKESPLSSDCRRAFHALLAAAGYQGRMPKIVACGARSQAYRDFCRYLQSGEVVVLLVDSEAPVIAQSPWEHVKAREGDRWGRPSGAGDEQLHLMVQCMEAWFLADREAIRALFGSQYRENALPPAGRSVESVDKVDVYAAMEKATTSTYIKGKHSFKLLATVDPALVRQASPWAERFFSTLARLLDGTTA